MRFLRRFRRAAVAALPTPFNPEGPEPTSVPPAPDGTNPIHALLEEAGLPWRDPRWQVEARYGISHDLLYDNDAVFFPDAVQPPGFMQPWCASVFERYSPDMPVVRFSGHVWFGDNAGINIERLADHFSARLGSAPVAQEYNTLVCHWRSGTASLRLITWPPAWQSRDLQNDAHAREPRLETAVTVTLLTGFRLPLTEGEARWVDASRPVAGTRPRPGLPSGGLRDAAPGETELEYARDPTGYLPAVHGQVGVPPGREALILGTDQLFVVPARDVLGFEVTRLLPAKGGGGSTLTVRCRTTCPAIPYKTLFVAQHEEPDGIVPLGRNLAAAFGAACEVSPYYDDV